MFNIMFAIPRSTGWIAHWREMMGDKVIKIYRPRQIYVGQPLREFVPMKDRKPAPAFSLTSSSKNWEIIKDFYFNNNLITILIFI